MKLSKVEFDMVSEEGKRTDVSYDIHGDEIEIATLSGSTWDIVTMKLSELKSVLERIESVTEIDRGCED